MAIDSNPVTSPTVLLAVYNSSGNFVVPAGKTKVYVTALSAIGGQGGSSSTRYGNFASGPGGDARVSGAWVNVIPGSTYTVTIGAAGSAGAQGSRYSTGGTGGAGGTTIFSAANVFAAPGSAGGTAPPNAPASNTPGTKGATAANATFATSVGQLTPWSGVQGIVNTTNGNITNSSGNGNFVGRYSPGVAGTAGEVYIYG